MSEVLSTVEAPPARPRGRWTKILLIASLAVNALVIGMVARTAWQMRFAFATAPGALEARLPGFIDQLPAPRRDALRKEGMIDRPAQLRPLRQELRRARHEAAQAFTADPFDKQAFSAAEGRVLEAEGKLRAAVMQILPDIASRLTAVERKEFLRWRPPGPRGGPGPGGPRRGPGPGPGPGPEPRD